MTLDLRSPRGLPAVALPDEIAAILVALAFASETDAAAVAAEPEPPSRWRAAGRKFDA